MTVEETPLPTVCSGQAQPRDEHLNLALAQIREVTGASDDVIEEAIRACSLKDGTFKVEDVVTTIIGDDVPTTVSKGHSKSTRGTDDVDAKAGRTSSTSSGVAPVNQGSQTGQRKSSGNDFINLDTSRDQQGILGGQITREEQDISRVLEASLAESKGSTKRKRGELWFEDPLNPHERKRLDGWPVGLRNVGNTCWFSAVIQSLFHIQKFRDIVLNFKTRPLTENEVNHKLRLVCELRQLFGLMLGSHRKYVDPSTAVNILKEASSTSALDGQQDVSEFQHKLLDWLEEAFATCQRGTTPANPVHQLFQGKYKAEGVNQGKEFSQEVTFGQYPLNVLGFGDIHESLEATTAQGEIETVSGDSSHFSGQEIWFTNLPVVLTFELSRFGFNQQLNRAEKIHQQLSFPPVIYVDRYLESNKSITRQKREEARKLKDELVALQSKLDRFLNYGSNTKRYPLPDVLQYALEFAESSPGSRRSPQPASTPLSVTTATTVSTLRGVPGATEDIEMRSPGGEQFGGTSSSPASAETCIPSPRIQSDSSSQKLPPLSIASSTPSKPSSVNNTTNPESSSASRLSSTQRSSSSDRASDRHLIYAQLNPSPLSPSHSSSSSSSAPYSQSAASSLSPAPEAKRFKDSSVQVEFNATLMPQVAMTTCQSDVATGTTTILSLRHSQPQSPSSSENSSRPKVSSSSVHGSHQQPSCHEERGQGKGDVTLTTITDPSLGTPPHPRSCSHEELVVLQGCLRRWREEVEADVRELQQNISSLEGKLDRMYSDESLKKYPYHLHAVLVHEGQAVSGHYWAFIHDWNNSFGQTSSSNNGPGSGKNGDDGAASASSLDKSACVKEKEETCGRWLKFNDITVSESSLSEVQREGFGGHHNASAYCLMYIDRSRLEIGQGDSNSSAATVSITNLSSLPTDLQQYINEDNDHFRLEMAKWDEEQKRKASATSAPPPHTSPAHQPGGQSVSSPGSSSSTGSNSRAVSSSHASGSSVTSQGGASGSREVRGQSRSSVSDPDVVMTGEQRPGETSIMKPMNSNLHSLADAHARLSLQATLLAVTEVQGRGNTAGNHKPLEIFKGAMQKELNRLQSLTQSLTSRLTVEDLRLNHIVLYLLSSGADNKTVHVVQAEQFALCGLLDSATPVKGVRHEAQDIYRNMYIQGGAEGIKCYEFWHKRYNHFRHAVLMFCEGVTAYLANKYLEALPYFNQACLHNVEPGLAPALQAAGVLNVAWLGFFRRNTLQKVNELALHSFERDADLADALTVMTHQILPTLALLSHSSNPKDQTLVEEIRGVWCQFLEKDLTEEKIEKLEDFLSKMFEGAGGKTEEPHRVKQSYFDTLGDRYTRTMRRLKEAGHTQMLQAMLS